MLGNGWDNPKQSLKIQPPITPSATLPIGEKYFLGIGTQVEIRYIFKALNLLKGKKITHKCVTDRSVVFLFLCTQTFSIIVSTVLKDYTFIVLRVGVDTAI